MPFIPEPVDPKAFLTLVEMPIDPMYELEAVGTLREHMGLITKGKIVALAKDLKQQMPPSETPASPPEYFLAAFFTNTEKVFIEQIMEIILQSGLSSQQAQSLLRKTTILLEWGEKVATKTTH